VVKQLENFENKVVKKVNKNLSNKQLHEVVNLASIVEKEEKIRQNKPIVAGILKKRLRE
jgi:cell division protein YceG involved in septum cleavage